MADGTLVFDTSIDEKGINDAGKMLDSSLKRMSSKLKAAFGLDVADKASEKITKLRQKYDEATAAVERQREEVENLRREIQTMQSQPDSEDTYQEPEAAKPLIAQAEQIKAQLTNAQAEAKKYGDLWRQGIKGADTDQMDWTQEAMRLKEEYNKVLNEIEKIEQKAEKSGTGTQSQADKVAELNGQLVQSEAKLNKLEDSATSAKSKLNAALDEKKPKRFQKNMSSAASSVKNFGKRIGSLVKSALIFSVITKALTKVREAFGNVLKSNTQFSKSWARIKGNLLTAFQPIYEACLPAIMTLMQYLEKATAVLASFFAALTGKSVAQMQKNASALYKQSNATKKAGDEAKKASRSLASFDEINQLSDNSSSKSDESDSTSIEPSFESNISELDKTAAKIASYGSLLVGTALLIFGIATANIPAIISGIALIAVGIKLGESTGAFEDTPPWLKQVITWGSMLIGLAMVLIALLSSGGLNIPLLISGLALMGVGIAYGSSSGAFDEAGKAISDFLKDIKDKLKSWWDGIKEWFNEHIKPIFTKEYWQEKWDNIKQSVSDSVSNIKTMITDTLTNTKNSAKEKIDSIKNGIVDGFNSAKDKVVSILNTLKTKVSDIWNGIWNVIKSVINSVLSGIERFVNGIIKGLNFAINALNRLQISIPDWVPEYGGKKLGFNIKNISEVTLPRLATGTYIPANYGEFAAILGDNKREAEVVSPISAMKQAFLEALAEGGSQNGGSMVINLVIDRDVIGKAFVEYHNGVVARTRVSPLKGVR